MTYPSWLQAKLQRTKHPDQPETEGKVWPERYRQLAMQVVSLRPQDQQARQRRETRPPKATRECPPDRSRARLRRRISGRPARAHHARAARGTGPGRGSPPPGPAAASMPRCRRSASASRTVWTTPPRSQRGHEAVWDNAVARVDRADRGQYGDQIKARSQQTEPDRRAPCWLPTSQTAPATSPHATMTYWRSSEQPVREAPKNCRVRPLVFRSARIILTGPRITKGNRKFLVLAFQQDLVGLQGNHLPAGDVVAGLHPHPERVLR